MKISQGDLSYYALKNRDSHLVSSAKSVPPPAEKPDPFLVIFLHVYFCLDHCESLPLVSDCDN